MNWLKSLLVDDWPQAWKWATTWVAAALVAFGSLDAASQADLLALVLGIPLERVPLVAGGLVFVARMWAQRKADHGNAP
jgi:hypothetical protein